MKKYARSITRLCCLVTLAVFVSAGSLFAADVVMIVGWPDMSGESNCDGAMVERLESNSHTVTVVDDNDIYYADEKDIDLIMAGKDLVIISATVLELRIRNKLKDIELPFIVGEQKLYDNMGMTAVDEWGRDFDLVPEIRIVDSTHPLSAGYSGTVTIATENINIRWGYPGDGAEGVAVAPYDENKVTIFGYDQGAPLADGSVAPAKRVGSLLFGHFAHVMNGTGWALFDAAVDWCLN